MLTSFILIQVSFSHFGLFNCHGGCRFQRAPILTQLELVLTQSLFSIKSSSILLDLLAFWMCILCMQSHGDLFGVFWHGFNELFVLFMEFALKWLFPLDYNDRFSGWRSMLTYGENQYLPLITQAGDSEFSTFGLPTMEYFSLTFCEPVWLYVCFMF